MNRPSSKILGLSLKLALFFCLSQVVVVAVFLRKLPPQVPLFYSQPWGERQLAPPLLYFLLPFFSVIIIGLNKLLSVFLAKKEELAKQLLMIFATIFSFLCLVALVKNIILIV